MRRGGRARRKAEASPWRSDDATPVENLSGQARKEEGL